MLQGAVICVFDRKQCQLGTGRGSYAVILLVLPLGSLTIAKYNGLSVLCFVVAYFSALYMCTTFEYLVRILLHVDNLRKRYYFTEIAETTVHAQAVDTRPSLSSHVAWVRG